MTAILIPILAAGGILYILSKQKPQEPVQQEIQQLAQQQVQQEGQQPTQQKVEDVEQEVQQPVQQPVQQQVQQGVQLSAYQGVQLSLQQPPQEQVQQEVPEPVQQQVQEEVQDVQQPTSVYKEPAIIKVEEKIIEIMPVILEKPTEINTAIVERIVTSNTNKIEMIQAPSGTTIYRDPNYTAPESQIWPTIAEPEPIVYVLDNPAKSYEMAHITQIKRSKCYNGNRIKVQTKYTVWYGDNTIRSTGRDSNSSIKINSANYDAVIEDLIVNFERVTITPSAYNTTYVCPGITLNVKDSVDRLLKKYPDKFAISNNPVRMDVPL